MKKISFLLLVILLLPLISSPALSFSADAPRRGSEEPELRDSYDVIVAGAGTGGVAAHCRRHARGKRPAAGGERLDWRSDGSRRRHQHG